MQYLINFYINIITFNFYSTLKIMKLLLLCLFTMQLALVLSNIFLTLKQRV